MTSPQEPWFAVRCIFAETRPEAPTRYEERITIWRAASFDEAVIRAEKDAQDYAKNLEQDYLGLAQAFHLFVEEAPADGDEVFSLIRESELPPEDYVTRFFDTGSEYEGNLGEHA